MSHGGWVRAIFWDIPKLYHMNRHSQSKLLNLSAPHHDDYIKVEKSLPPDIKDIYQEVLFNTSKLADLLGALMNKVHLQKGQNKPFIICNGKMG